VFITAFLVSSHVLQVSYYFVNPSTKRWAAVVPLQNIAVTTGSDAHECDEFLLNLLNAQVIVGYFNTAATIGPHVLPCLERVEGDQIGIKGSN
jgi:hypothetical protein